MSEGVSTIPTQYTIRRVSLDCASDDLLADWRSISQQLCPDSPQHDPEWLRGYFEGQAENIFLYALYREGSLCGLVPFILKDWPLKCQLGELTLASFPLRRLRLLGGAFNFPDDPAAYEMFFSELMRSDSGFDAVYLEEVPVDSFLWRYLQSSELPAKVSKYQPEAPSSHPLLRLEGSFEQYMGKFSSKHRKNLLREVKKIREGSLGAMQFTRFQSREEVPFFLEQAIGISKQTYQWKLHGRGLQASDTLRKRLVFAAGRGWMRSYLLSCGGQVCAFLVGFQYEGRFLLHEIGYDPSLAKHSVGTVLQLLTVEDLFAHNRPRILDLGDYGKYKEMLSTESYEQARVFLFRRGVRSRLIQSIHHGCQLSTQTCSTILERWGLKAKIKRAFREGATRTAEA